MIVLVNITLIGLNIMISYFMNRNFNLDLKSGVKIVREERVQNKEYKTDYEAGSGTLFIPVLGNLIPKLWGQEMRPNEKLSLIINGFHFEVEKELYSKVKENDVVLMYYSMYSDTLLGIELK